MTPQQFWYEDPDWFWAYKSAKEMSVKENLNNMNYTTWLQGIYMTQAIAASFDKKNKYPREPLDLGIEEGTQQKREEEKIKRQYQTLKNWSNAFKGKYKKDTKK